MKFVKNMFNLILSFLLTIIVILSVLMCIVDFKVLSINYYKNIFEKNGFYEAVLEEVNSGFENFIYQSGLPENIIVDLATKEVVKKDIDNIVASVINNETYSFSSEVIKEKLDLRINEFIEKENRTLTKEEKNNIIKFEELIVSSYEESILPVKGVIEPVKDYAFKITNIFNKIKVIPIVVLIVLILIINMINKNEKIKVVNYIGITVLSAGIILVLLENVLFKNIDIDNIVVFTNSMTNLVKVIFKDIVYGIGSIGKGLSITGFCMVLFYSILYENGIKNLGKAISIKII